MSSARDFDITAPPEKTVAIVVGIEASGLNPARGSAEAALGFAGWLARHLRPEQITLALSPAAPADRLQQCGLVGATKLTPNRDDLDALFTDGLAGFEGQELLLLFWAGHGMWHPPSDRRLFFANTTPGNRFNLSVESLLTLFLSETCPVHQQVCLFDACANLLLKWQGALPDGRLASPPLRPPQEVKQFVLYSTRLGETALAAEHRADQPQQTVFSGPLLEKLEDTLKRKAPGQETWLPDMVQLAEDLAEQFTAKVKPGPGGQEPEFWAHQVPNYVWLRTPVGNWEPVFSSPGAVPAGPVEVGAAAAESTRGLMGTLLAHFVGRADALAGLDGFLDSRLGGRCLVSAPPGYGKSALLAQWAHRLEGRTPTLHVLPHFFKRGRDLTQSVEQGLRNIVGGLWRTLKLPGPVPGGPQDVWDTLRTVWKKTPIPPGDKVIIVIDGLDEADRPFEFPFSDAPTEGLYVVFSYREGWTGGTSLATWTGPAERVPLGRLGPDDIDEYLRVRGEGALDPLTRNPDVTEDISRVTDGYPLHVHYLVEDLITCVQKGGDWREVLHSRSPTGFDAYVRDSFEGLAQELREAQLPQTWDIVPLLAVARGHVEERELSELTDLTLRQVRDALGDWRLTRWLDIQGPFGKRSVWLAHPQLARSFAQVYRDEAEEGKSRLLAYCAGEAGRQGRGARDWQARGAYAVRYYAEHLEGTDLVNLLNDYSYLEAKAGRLGIDALLAELRRADGVLSAVEEARPVVRELLPVLDREANNLRGWDPRQSPALLTQQVYVRSAGMRLQHQQRQAEARLQGASRPYFQVAWRTGGDSPELKRTLSGHDHPVRAVVITPDGSRVVSMSESRELLAWDLETGHREGVLNPASKYSTPDDIALVLTADGRQVIGPKIDSAELRDNGVVMVWDIETGRAVGTLDGYCTAFWRRHARESGALPGGWLLHGSGSTLTIRSLHDRRRTLRVIDTSPARIAALAVTPDGATALVGTNDGAILRWELATGSPLRPLAGHRAEIRSVAATPNGDWAASRDTDGVLKVWDLRQQSERWTLADYRDDPAVVTPDGLRALARDGKEVRVWDLATGQLERTLRGHAGQVNAVAVTPDGKTAVSAANDRTLRVWDIAAARTESESSVSTGHVSAVTALAVTPDGECVLSGSRDGMRVWAVRTGAQERLPGEPDRAVDKIVLTAEGRQAVVLSSSGSIVLYTAPGGAEWSGKRTIRVWDLGTKAAVCTVEIPYGDQADQHATRGGGFVEDPRQGRSILISGDGRHAVAAARNGDGFLVLLHWDLQTAKKSSISLQPEGLALRAVWPDGGKVVLTANENLLRVVDLWNGEQIGGLDREPAVLDVQVTRDGRRVLTIWDDLHVTVLDVGRGEVRLWAVNPSLEFKAWTPDGSAAILSRDHGTMAVLPLTSGGQFRFLHGHTGPIESVAVTADGRRAVSGSEDRSVRLWDLDGGKELAAVVLDYPIRRVTFALNDEGVIAGDEAGNLHCLRLVHAPAK
jgi:WD40 repeat protein